MNTVKKEEKKEEEAYKKATQSNFLVLQTLALNLRNIGDSFQKMDISETNDFFAEVANEIYSTEENLIDKLNKIIQKHNVSVAKLSKY